MIKKHILTILSVILAISASAQEKKISSGDITFKSEKKNISFTASKFESKIDIEAKKISFSLPIDNFEIDNKMQKKHFSSEKGMKTGEFATATFEGSIVTDSSIINGENKVTIEGTLTILGVGVEISIPASINMMEDGIKASATFKVNRAAHKATTNYADMLDKDIEVVVNAIY